MTPGAPKVRLAIWIAALGLWAGTPSLSHAQLLRADLSVNGLTCPFCAFGIEKKLRAVDGVLEVDVLLDEGEVRLTLATGNTATIGAFERAVERAGFEISGLRVEVQGSVARREGDAFLEADNALRFRLLEADNGRTRPISESQLQRILAGAMGGAVRLRGSVESERDGIRGLVVDATPGAP